MDTKHVIALPFGASRFADATLAGKGGMGAVYRAFDKRLERPVAIKVLDTSIAQPEARLADRFLAEARAVARVSHPNVVQVFDVSDGPPPHMVMEWVDGRSLDHSIRDGGAMEPRVAARIIRDIARGLAHAHSLGVIHRDIKPANIIVDAAGAPKLIDFGIAKFAQGDANLTRANVVVGTPNFLAPEQIRGLPIDGRTDEYALGITFYALLYGRLPFAGDSTEEVFRHHLETPLPHLDELEPRVGKKLVAILRRMTAKDRELRFADCGAVGAALDDWLEQRESASPEAATFEPTAANRPTHRAKSHVRTTALALLALAAVAGIAFVATRGEKTPAGDFNAKSPSRGVEKTEPSPLGVSAPLRQIPDPSTAPANPLAFVVISARDAATSIASTVETELSSAFARAGHIRIVERAQLDAVLQENLRSRSVEFDPKTALAIGHKLAARVAVFGSVVAFGPNNVLSVRSVDTLTGVQLAQESTEWRRGAAWSATQPAIRKVAATLESATLRALDSAPR
ncbi:MAG: protein kinase [Deltaproteobacteria bacterium]|nr:protein kinase [Deltaproteobacteria bacterium]